MTPQEFNKKYKGKYLFEEDHRCYYKVLGADENYIHILDFASPGWHIKSLEEMKSNRKCKWTYCEYYLKKIESFVVTEIMHDHGN